GPRLVAGGGRAGSRGILETRREIKELRELIAADRERLRRLGDEAVAHEADIARATSAIAALNAEHHEHEKVIVACRARMAYASEEETRLSNKAKQLARE